MNEVSACVRGVCTGRVGSKSIPLPLKKGAAAKEGYQQTAQLKIQHVYKTKINKQSITHTTINMYKNLYYNQHDYPTLPTGQLCVHVCVYVYVSVCLFIVYCLHDDDRFISITSLLPISLLSFPP